MIRYQPKATASKKMRMTSRPAYKRPLATKKYSIPKRLPTFFGFPRQLVFKHKYCETVAVASAAGVMANYRFRTNGLFDPNFTQTGHQPSYYDNLAAIYDHYVVTSSRIVVTATQNASGAANTVFGVAINDDTSTTPTSIGQYGEATDVKMVYLGLGQSSGPGVVTMNWNAVKAFGPNPMANTSLLGTPTADPSEQQIFDLFVQAVDQTSSVAVNYLIYIEYYATWFELKDLITS